MTNWYAVYVLSGRENKTRDLLLNRAKNTNLWGSSIIDILIPTEKEYVTRKGKRQIVDKKVFPGYLFVKMHLDKEAVHIVQGTDGITGFVRSGTKPVPVNDTEMNRIMKSIVQQDNTPKSSYKTNDIVLIVDGPFADFNGKVESLDESRGKLKCYIQIFGRETIVELLIDQVQLC